MRLKLRAICGLVLLYLAVAAGAGEAIHGAFFPLANTRYGLAPAENGVLATDGVDAYVFFGSRGSISMARVADGKTRGTARVVLENTYNDPAAIWNGTHFLVVASTGNGIACTLVERDGTPLRKQFSIDPNGYRPKLAFNGEVVLLLMQGLAVVLDPIGRPISRHYLPTSAIALEVTSNGEGFAAVATTYNSVVVHAFDRAGALRTTTQIGLSGGPVAIASDGHDYLGVVEERTGNVFAFPISATGSIGEIVKTDRLRRTWLGGLAWIGDGYALVYRGEWLSELQVGHLSRDGVMVSSPQNAGPNSGRVGLIAFGGRLYLLRTDGNRPATVQELRTGAGVITTGYRAQDQVLLAVATSDNGTLFVWSEGQSVYAGVRTATGSWMEHVALGYGVTGVVAASDGDEFLVVGRSWAWRAQRLRANGAPRGVPVTVADANYEISDMAWNGRNFIAVGIRYGEVTAFGIDRDFEKPKAVVVGRSTGYAYPRVGSDGRNALVAWGDNARVYATRLGPYLQLLDEGPRRIGDSNFTGLDRVLWTGNDYLVVWHKAWGGLGLFAAHVHRDGRRSDGVLEIVAPQSHAGAPTDVQAVNAGGRVAVTWTEPPWTPRVRRFVTIDRDAIVEHSLDESPLVSRVLLIPIGDRLGFAGSLVDNDTPYYGGSRLMLALSETHTPAAPQRLELVASAVRPDEAELTWTAPSKPVNGYRVEGRIGDGAWNEIERWFSTEERSVKVYLSEPGGRASFRVRAMNDAGPGPYSNEAVVNGSRRRAVR